MPVIHISDFIGQAAQGVSQLGLGVSSFASKLREAEANSQFNSGRIAIDNSFDKYLDDFIKQIQGDPQNPKQPLPTTDDYKKAREQFVQSQIEQLPNLYKNKDAVKALTNYLQQKDLVLSNSMDERYQVYQVAGLQTQTLDTAQNIAENTPIANAKGEIDGLFQNSVDYGIFDPLTSRNTKQEYYKLIYQRDTNEVNTLGSNLIKQIESGADISTQREIYSKRLDTSVAMGRITADDKNILLNDFDNSSQDGGIYFQARAAMKDSLGFLKDTALEDAIKVIDSSDTTQARKDIIRDNVIKAYSSDLSVDTIRKNTHDKPLIDEIQNDYNQIGTTDDPEALYLSLQGKRKEIVDPQNKTTWQFANQDNKQAVIKAIDSGMQGLMTIIKNKKEADTKNGENGETMYLNWVESQVLPFYPNATNPVGDKQNLTDWRGYFVDFISRGGFAFKQDDAMKLLGTIDSKLNDIAVYEKKQEEESIKTATAAATAAAKATAEQQKATIEQTETGFYTQIGKTVTEPFSQYRTAPQSDTAGLSLYAALGNALQLQKDINDDTIVTDPEKKKALQSAIASQLKDILDTYDQLDKTGQITLATQIGNQLDSLAIDVGSLKLDSSPQTLADVSQEYKKTMKNVHDLLVNLPAGRIPDTSYSQLWTKLGTIQFNYFSAVSGANQQEIQGKVDQLDLAAKQYEKTGDFDTYKKTYDSIMTPQTAADGIFQILAQGQTGEYQTAGAPKGLTDTARQTLVKNITNAMIDYAGAEKKEQDKGIKNTQQKNYQELNGQLDDFDIAEASYTSGGKWEDYAKSFEELIGDNGITKSLGSMNLTSEDYGKVKTRLIQSVKSFYSNSKTHTKDLQKMALGKADDIILDDIKTIADTVDNYVDLNLYYDKGSPDGKAFYDAVASLEAYSTQLPDLYVKDNPDLSQMSESGYTDATKNVSDALGKARRFIAEGVKTAASNEKEAAKKEKEAITDQTDSQFWTLYAAQSTGKPLPSNVGGFKAGSIITGVQLQAWTNSNSAYLSQFDSKIKLALNGESVGAKNARATLEDYLNTKEVQDKLKNGTLSLSDVNGFRTELDRKILGANGEPSDALIGSFLDSVKARVEKGKPVNIQLQGSGGKLNGDACTLIVSMANGLLENSVGQNNQQRYELARQMFKSGGVYLGYSENDAESMMPTATIEDYANVNMFIDNKQVVMPSYTVFKYKNKYYTFVPTKYDGKKFTGSIQFASYDPTSNTIKPLSNQSTNAELQKAQIGVNNKMDSAYNRFSREGGMFDSTLLSDPNVLKMYSLKPGSTLDDLAKIIVDKYYGIYNDPKIKDKTSAFRQYISPLEIHYKNNDYSTFYLFTSILSAQLNSDFANINKRSAIIDAAMGERK